jgi:lipid II:glycine glycyltransferase (peptidoglycan interpeptide bridge formation enzyme)
LLECIVTLEDSLVSFGFRNITLKITPDIFSQEKSDLLQYMLFNCGYNQYMELSTYIDFDDYDENTIKNFSTHNRKHLNRSIKHNLRFRVLEADQDICEYHRILAKNLTKFNAKPIHSVEDFLLFKRKQLTDIVEFYGVYLDDVMIAGAMMFKMRDVVHGQNLNSDSDYSKYYPTLYLYYNAINRARENGYKKLSWGISTEQHGAILNQNLLRFKESFGSKYAVNHVFYKEITDENTVGDH